MKTAREKVYAFYEEFPWLEKYIEPEGIYSINVSRINHTFLNTYPRRWVDVNCFLHEEKVHFLDENGECLETVGRIPPKPDATFRWWKIWKWFQRMDKIVEETPSGTLERMGNESSRVHFILFFSEHVAGCDSVYPRRVIIYKSPKGFTLKNWAEQIRLRAENKKNQQEKAVMEEVRSEVTAVDDAQED